MDFNYNVCENCFIEQDVKVLIQKIGSKVKCDLCGADAKCIDQDSIVEIQNYCQAYIMYHYDEDKYATRFGGDSIENLLEKDGKLLNFSRIVKNDKYRIFLDDLFNSQSTGLYMYTPDYPMLQAIKSLQNHRKYHEIFSSTSNYVDKYKTIREMYDEIKSYVEVVSPRDYLYRARNGHDNDKDQPWKRIPYIGNEIGSPPFIRCDQGRANRTYVSFLYLAEDENTAINEIRPMPSDFVSIGCFQANSDIKIFSLAHHNILRSSESDTTLDALRNISSLNNLFSMPTGSNNKHIYLATQLFTEILVSEGFDGICFNSSFTGKKNYAIFNPSHFKYVDGSGKLNMIKSLKCEITNIKAS